MLCLAESLSISGEGHLDCSIYACTLAGMVDSVDGQSVEHMAEAEIQQQPWRPSVSYVQLVVLLNLVTISNIDLWHEHECADWAACQCKAYLLVLMYTALKASCSCDMSNKPFTAPITSCTCHIHACNSVVIILSLSCCRHSSSAGWALLMLHLKTMISIACAQDLCWKRN